MNHPRSQHPRKDERSRTGGTARSGGDAHFPAFRLSHIRPTDWSLWIVILSAACAAAPLKIELPAETEVFKSGPGADIANGHCLACHSVEYVATQPPLPRVFWASSVNKMREKYGAAVPDDQVEPLLDYLTRYYGVDATNGAPVRASNSPSLTSAAGPSTPLTPELLATRYGCLGCHNVSVKIVGPPYREIAAKYRDDPEARRKISEQIRQGGSGKWGPIIMPPFPQVSEVETRALTDWILSAK